MSMLEWAKNEIEIACKRERGDKDPNEWDYGVACYESALKAFQSLVEDGHSGFSIGITKSILNRLIDRKPLTSIEDIPEAWWPFDDGINAMQCKRMSSLFKHIYEDGSIKYSDVDRVRCKSKDNPDGFASWYSGFIENIVNELYPITMPYNPPSKPFTVYCTDGLIDPKNGDFDILGVWYMVKPDGSREDIDRFFKEVDESWVEIDKEEYEKLSKRANKEEV